MDPFVVHEQDTTTDAPAGVPIYRIVKRSNATQVVKATGSTDKPVGISQQYQDSAGGAVRVAYIGIVPLEYGGTINWGDKITSDANGKGVAAAPSAGVNAEIIGVCMLDGISGDIGLCLISISTLQG